ncbi:aminotransferase class I/II-fold pyridoxal phosphate-dependent enzyme [Bacillus sp. B1-b2]|uniref:aminotransferase class I/II-fold pyridoxal phosphate-dependent enzyme n=1 Tax=Bacillus sp. B1-b2 TaxID=2653201 RepID=UPI0012614C7B|nr:aminotransferase class I/II-fold pyridoxal phosphate-dependent enzyme [Bacillus sp. B1-b2]KAB7663255.1 aminotransferase class I/II-fold pyridoxal phosphate-dependent enzyme [Bacillus sp. B1-b2]
MQEKTPLYSMLLDFQSNNNISYHVPGHKSGQLIDEESMWKDHLWEMDVTELTDLDDLHSPTGVIAEAEALLATLYKVKKSFFLVNGSTVGNLAMILAAIEDGDKVFVQRNSHKSIMNGIKLARGVPVLLHTEYNEEWDVETVLSAQTLKQAIEEYPDVKTLVITSPNYYGMVGDLRSIIELAHLHGICVLVDEAHGAHLIGRNAFPHSAIECGADIVVQSAHKTLPALTMGAYLHYNTNRVSKDRLKKYLEILQTSSPSYLIMASLDKARNYLATFQLEDEQYLLAKIEYFRHLLKKVRQVKVLDFPASGDPLKITIQSRCEYSGFEIQKMLEAEGIYTEMADSHNILFVFPLLKKEQNYPIEETVEKIAKVLANSTYADYKHNEWKDAVKNEMNVVELKLSEKEQSLLQKESISLNNSMHHICAESIIPYPPGIPILLPGEEITSHHINQIQKLIKAGARFQGNEYIYEGKIMVYINK